MSVVRYHGIIPLALIPYPTRHREFSPFKPKRRPVMMDPVPLPKLLPGLFMDIGQFLSRTCGGISRRGYLRASLAAPFALAGAPMLAAESKRDSVRAKSVIFVWLWGAPSHLDTFDPKPDASADIRGPFAAIPTRTPGLRFTELLPKLAARSDLFNVVHSHVTFAGGHPDAGTYGLTGFAEKPTPVKPNFGAIVGKHRGASSGNLASFTMLGRGIPKDVVRIVDGYGGGSLGKIHDPFLISCSEQGEAEIPSLALLEGLSPHRIQDRRGLLDTLDTARRDADRVSAASWRQMHHRAHDLLTVPEARQALDLTRESDKTREAYGQTSFGQSCLMARRMVEAGVPYIQVNWSEYVEAMTPNADFGWDTHIYNFELLPDRHCPILDRALSALLDDLRQRGLLESTLVVAMGEFGRTPKITNRAARDHWPRCYSSLWAGAGMNTGRVIGASDRIGSDPITAPVTPLMVGTTIAELAGVDTQARAEMKVLEGGTVIHELLA